MNPETPAIFKSSLPPMNMIKLLDNGNRENEVIRHVEMICMSELNFVPKFQSIVRVCFHFEFDLRQILNSLQYFFRISHPEAAFISSHFDLLENLLSFSSINTFKVFESNSQTSQVNYTLPDCDDDSTTSEIKYSFCNDDDWDEEQSNKRYNRTKQNKLQRLISNCNQLHQKLKQINGHELLLNILFHSSEYQIDIDEIYSFKAVLLNHNNRSNYINQPHYKPLSLSRAVESICRYSALFNSNHLDAIDPLHYYRRISLASLLSHHLHVLQSTETPSKNKPKSKRTRKLNHSTSNIMINLTHSTLTTPHNNPKENANMQTFLEYFKQNNNMGNTNINNINFVNWKSPNTKANSVTSSVIRPITYFFTAPKKLANSCIVEVDQSSDDRNQCDISSNEQVDICVNNEICEQRSTNNEDIESNDNTNQNVNHDDDYKETDSENGHEKTVENDEENGDEKAVYEVISIDDNEGMSVGKSNSDDHLPRSLSESSTDSQLYVNTLVDIEPQISSSNSNDASEYWRNYHQERKRSSFEWQKQTQSDLIELQSFIQSNRFEIEYDALDGQLNHYLSSKENQLIDFIYFDSNQANSNNPTIINIDVNQNNQSVVNIDYDGSFYNDVYLARSICSSFRLSLNDYHNEPRGFTSLRSKVFRSPNLNQIVNLNQKLFNMFIFCSFTSKPLLTQLSSYFSSLYTEFQQVLSKVSKFYLIHSFQSKLDLLCTIQLYYSFFDLFGPLIDNQTDYVP